MNADPEDRRKPARFGLRRPPAASQLRKHHGFRSNQIFQALPQPTGLYPYHMSLDQVLPANAMSAIMAAGRLVFHIAGDTGGVRSPESQQIVAMKMEDDFHGNGLVPAFFYILGDLIYYNGEASEYYPQFYEPYINYPAPIFAIPGNHDGDPIDPSAPSLAAFVDNFCARERHVTADAKDATRDAMTQPNVYWTLATPFATIIGLYSNVPEGGRLDTDQIAWLQSELASAPPDRAIIVTMHHPIYSVDAHHGGSLYMGNMLDNAIQNSGRTPHLVLAGHVHNYQRFSRRMAVGQVPYIVAGAGGYYHLHYLGHDGTGQPIVTPWPVPGSRVTLENYVDDRHGFLRMELTAQTLKGDYVTVPRPQESWRFGPTEVVDSFEIDLASHRLTSAGRASS